MKETRASFRRKSLIQNETEKERPAPLLSRTGSLRRSVTAREENKGGMSRSFSFRQKRDKMPEDEPAASSRHKRDPMLEEEPAASSKQKRDTLPEYETEDNIRPAAHPRPKNPPAKAENSAGGREGVC
jgi:hypothetical protein